MILGVVIEPRVMHRVTAARDRLDGFHIRKRPYEDFILCGQRQLVQQRLVQRMPGRWQPAEKASTLAFAEVLVRGRIPRICSLDLQLQGRPRLDDLSRQLLRKARARGGVSQEPRTSEQSRITALNCIQLVLGDSLRVLSDYL